MKSNQQHIDRVRMKIRELVIKHPKLFDLIDFRNVNVIISNGSINAFASEDRSSDIISISSGLLENLDEFEAVLAHELTHIQKKHHNLNTSNRYSQISFIIAIICFIAYFILDISGWSFYIVALGLLIRTIMLHEKYGSIQSLNHYCEFEADSAAAKVNKNGLESVLLRISEKEDSQTHPGLAKRLKNIQSDRKF